MLELCKQIIVGQFEASLCMLNQCLEHGQEAHWDGKIANSTFRQIAYHTLFFADLYLTPGDEEDFELRDVHLRGGDERGPDPCCGLSKDESLGYLAWCLDKLHTALATETEASLQGPCGFALRRFSRAELYLYSIRHTQHHTGVLSAYLRRVDDGPRHSRTLSWVGTGWRS